MIIENNNSLNFAQDSKIADFWFEKPNRLVAELTISGDKHLVVFLTDEMGQIHIKACFPHKIIGKAAFILYEDFAQDASSFSFVIDPEDGLTYIRRYLNERSAACLDCVLTEIIETARTTWADLDGYAEFALAQSEEDREVYSIERMLAKESEGEDPIDNLLQMLYS